MICACTVAHLPSCFTRLRLQQVFIFHLCYQPKTVGGFNSFSVSCAETGCLHISGTCLPLRPPPYDIVVPVSEPAASLLPSCFGLRLAYRLPLQSIHLSNSESVTSKTMSSLAYVYAVKSQILSSSSSSGSSFSSSSVLVFFPLVSPRLRVFSSSSLLFHPSSCPTGLHLPPVLSAKDA